MTIKQTGGIFGRNPTFDAVTTDSLNISTVGGMGLFSGSLLYAGAGDTTLLFSSGGDAILPRGSAGASRDNAVDLGNATNRWDDIYATNGTIQTSDRNEKQDIAELSEAERRVAVAAKGLLRKFRWQSAVAEKGDDARIHFGIIAQDLQAAFAAEGLDAGDYAMFISTTWWEQAVEVPDAYTRIDVYSTEEEAPEGATQQTRLGVRYSELLAFIIAST